METVLEVRERPIIFSGPMVREILEGRKTMTRRVVNPQPKVIHAFYPDCSLETERIFRQGDQRVHCPYGAPGERLWVRESFAVISMDDWYANIARGERIPHGKTLADTDGGLEVLDLRENPTAFAWAKSHIDSDRLRPSIHMPRWASRLTLEITDVRVERVQDISEADAHAEGIQIPCDQEGLPWLNVSRRVDSHPLWKNPREATLADYWTGYYALLWNQINAKRGYGWNVNPWVWAITFRVAHAQTS